MKTKLLLSLMLAVLTAGAVSAAPAYRSGGMLSGQIFDRHHRHHHHHGGLFGLGKEHVRYETITVNRGRKVYRDTYRITTKNGREHRKRVEHVRIA